MLGAAVKAVQATTRLKRKAAPSDAAEALRAETAKRRKRAAPGGVEGGAHGEDGVHYIHRPAELIFYHGTMNCGKSTLALQLHHTNASHGLNGLVFGKGDRGGEAVLTSRIGASAPAINVGDNFDVFVAVKACDPAADYVICDEAQFYSSDQIEQLERVVDELGVDVHAFGLLTDFRTRLFVGSARLVELADRLVPLPVAALCWCGTRAIHNCRTVGGVMTDEGDSVKVGDVTDGAQPGGAAEGYETLCRRHYRARKTAYAALTSVGQ